MVFFLFFSYHNDAWSNKHHIQELSGQNICSAFPRNISNIEGSIIRPVGISVHTASDIILFATKEHKLCWTQGGWTCFNCRPVIHNHYRQLVTFVTLTVKRTASAVIDPFCIHMAAHKLTATRLGPNDHLIHLHRLQCAIFVVNFDTFDFIVVHIRYKYLIAFVQIQKENRIINFQFTCIDVTFSTIGLGFPFFAFTLGGLSSITSCPKQGLC